MKKRYTITYRIDDIIALIQILSIGNNTLRTEVGLKNDLGEPRSVKSMKWEDVARSHTEFFRYSDHNEYPFSLVARYTMPLIIEENSNQKKRDPIPNELVKELLNLAVLLHDKEVKRNEKWKIWLPPLIAGIPALIAIFMTIYRPSSEEYLTFKIELLTEKIEKMETDISKNVLNDSISYQGPKIEK